MEPRLIVAYGLIALFVVLGAAGFAYYSYRSYQRRRARRLRRQAALTARSTHHRAVASRSE